MFNNLPESVAVFEVGPRDGLQNEEKYVPTSDKVRLIQSLASAGLKNIEITSFVSPRWIPQLADGAQVAGAVNLPPDVSVSALVPNLQGYDSARQAGLRQIALFMSATETHSRKNINKGIDEALRALKEVAGAARADQKKIRAYVSVAFICPYEGRVPPEQVARLIPPLLEMGVDEISIGDTVGYATPKQVLELLKLISKDIDLARIALHCHDTTGTALSNVVAGLECGVKTFDASVGGMGGCPYAPGAAGNLATEDLVYLLHESGIKTGIDLEKLVDCGNLAQEILGKQLPGRYLQASLSKRAMNRKAGTGV